MESEPESTLNIQIPKTQTFIPYVPGYHFQTMCDEFETDTHYLAQFTSDESNRENAQTAKGQIALGTEFGMTLFLLMSQTDGPKLWLEVGTWNGNGSTTCLLEGLEHREDKSGVQLVSYEASPFYYEIAQTNLKRYDSLASYFQLLNGQLPITTPFPNPDDISDKSDHYMINYAEERYLYEHADQIPPPFAPEVAILDGGEYVGERDWESIPKQNLKHVFLDDICSDKNKGLHQRLKEDSEWECMIERKGERNGWAYWKKRNY